MSAIESNGDEEDDGGDGVHDNWRDRVGEQEVVKPVLVFAHQHRELVDEHVLERVDIIAVARAEAFEHSNVWM